MSLKPFIALVYEHILVDSQENGFDPTAEDFVRLLKQRDWPQSLFTPPLALQLVWELRAEGNKPLAHEVVDRAIAAYPENAEFFNEHGHLYVEEKKYDQAVDWFYRTIKKTPPSDPHLFLAALDAIHMPLRTLRRFDEAADMIQLVRDVTRSEPSGSLLVQQGWLCFHQSLYAEALDYFTTAEQKLDDNEQDEARLGQLVSQQQLDVLEPLHLDQNVKQLVSNWLDGRVAPEEIVRMFIECNDVLERLNLYPAALRNADHFLQHAPNHPKAVYFKLSALKWLRLYARAERTFLDAPHELQTNIEIWNERANNFFEQKLYKQAYLHYSGKVLEGRELSAAEERLKIALKNNLEAREWTIVSLRKMRRFDEARREVKAALASFDKKLNFLSELGALYYAQRDYDNAIKLYDEALKLDDYDTFALQWRTASLRKKGKIAEAVEALDKALKKVPYSTRLWDECGWLAYDQGKYEEAIKAFEQANALDPYLINKQFAKVETLLLMKRSDDALEVFKKLDQQFPGDAEVAEQLCWFYIRTGQLELAREQQVRLRQSHPHNALAFNAEGGSELALRNYEKAETAFRNALKEVDYEPQHYVNLALALIRQVKSRGELTAIDKPQQDERIGEAKSLCRKALELDPYNARAYGCLGVIAYRQDAFLDAEFYFQKSIEVSPNEGSYVELGSLYCQMGCFDKATTTLQKALQLNINDALAYIELGNVAVMNGNNKEAIRYCREALHVGPKNPDTHRALAIALMRDEQYNEAELIVRTALRSLDHAKPWRLYLLLAEILVRIADASNKDRKKKDVELYQEALAHVNEAKRMRTPHADILFHSGIVHYKLDDFATSHKSFAECLKLNTERFDAERNGRIVQAVIAQQKRLFTVNKWFGIGLAAICIALLVSLWLAYFLGAKRTILFHPPTSAESTTPVVPFMKDEFIVDQSLLNVMTPILLGLFAIAALLPNLSKLKLPGLEAEIVEPKPTDPNISTGPRGDVVFGTSLPIIDPEPR